MSEPVTRVRPSVNLDEFERRMGAGMHDGHHEDPLAELARLVGEEPDPYRDVFARDVAERVPALPGNFAAIEAGLRGTYAPEPQHEGYYDPHEQYDYETREAHAYAQTPSPSRRPMYLMAATIAVGVLGIGAAFSLKGHSTSPADVKTIMAATGPTKIQPPADASGDQNTQDAGVLGKGNQPSPTGLANNKEEPVDVTQAVQNTARGSTDASSVPVPPPPGQAEASVPGPSSNPNDFGIGMPAPKKVKVVSVRPDGTILSDDSPSAAPSSPDTTPTASAPSTSPAQAPVAKASTPKVTPPAKSATRITPKAAKTDSADSTNAPDSQTPADSGAKAHKTKSTKTKVAMAEPTDTNASANAPDEAAAKSTGSFAVQLAAPGSEADARSASSRLAKKYASALAGRHLAFHKAESNGKSVYRVRVGSLSREDATSLCEKLKADGGSCFVAKN